MVGRLTKILEPNTDHARYVVHIKQMAKYVVDLDKNLSPTDVEEGKTIIIIIRNENWSREEKI